LPGDQLPRARTYVRELGRYASADCSIRGLPLEVKGSTGHDAAQLVEVTEGTFQLEPEGFLNLTEHSAVAVRWWAERGGQRSEGREIGVYQIRDGRITQVWFYNEASDAQAFSTVFAFD
jgi:hypothetical protein